MKRSSFKNFCSHYITFYCLFILFGYNNRGNTQPSEYLLKAVFLEKFTRFIEWPDHLIDSDTTSAFTIGIFGRNPFDIDLETLYTGQKIKNHQVKIQYFDRLSQIDQCHLLFISQSEKHNIQKIKEFLQNKPVLTVGDTQELSGKGIIINLFVADHKIRFEIDEQAFNSAGFHVSYLLLKEAVIVNPN